MSDMKYGDLKRNWGLGVSACVIGIAVFLIVFYKNEQMKIWVIIHKHTKHFYLSYQKGSVLSMLDVYHCANSFCVWESLQLKRCTVGECRSKTEQ